MFDYSGGSKVYYNGKYWQAAYWTGKNEGVPGVNPAWTQITVTNVYPK